MAASNATKAIGTMLRIQSKRKNKTKLQRNGRILALLHFRTPLGFGLGLR